MDANYESVDIEDINIKAKKLDEEQKESLCSLLNKYKQLFDGVLGDFDVPYIKLEVEPGTYPVHSRPFHVPPIHRKILCKEIQCIVSMCML